MNQPYDPAKHVEQRMASEINKITTALQSAEQDVRARLPERHFREIYLPMFAGDEKLLYDINLGHWVNFAGNPYRGVDIIDEKGNVLFTVPPVFDRDTINPTTANRRTLFEVMETAQQYANIHPHQGLKYLDSELTGRALIMKVPANVAKDLDTWNMIFQRYGRPPLAKVSKKDSDKKESTAAPDDDFDFEPL